MQEKYIFTKNSSSRDWLRFSQNVHTFALPLFLYLAQLNATHPFSKRSSSLSLNMPLVILLLLFSQWRQSSSHEDKIPFPRQSLRFKDEILIINDIVLSFLSVENIYQTHSNTEVSFTITDSNSLELLTLDSYSNWRSFVYKTLLLRMPYN